MAEILFISPTDLTDGTIISGNTDIDNYLYCILDTQVRVLEPILGSLLYDKIKTDLDSNSLAGLYLELYSEYVKPITKFESCATYLEVASYMVTNGGVLKHSPEGKEVVSKDEVYSLSQKYHGTSDMYIIRLKKWFCKHGSELTEYISDQDEVKPNKNVRTIAGWRF